jgi:transposase
MVPAHVFYTLIELKSGWGSGLKKWKQGGIHRNKVIVSLANKLARVIWAVLTHKSTFYLSQQQ